MFRSAIQVSFILAFAGLAIAGCGKVQGKPPIAASIPGAATAAPQSADQPAAAKPPVDKQHPVVVLHTSLGDITLRLDAEQAPISVDNFLEYAQKGHYDGTIFHQVLTKPAVVMAGGYDAFQHERPAGLTIRNEAHNGLKNVRGAVGMTRSPDSIDSSTCQFYVNVADNPQLDHKSNEADGYGYCVFGEVIAGMEIVDQIAKGPLHDTEHLKSTPAEQVLVKWVHLDR